MGTYCSIASRDTAAGVGFLPYRSSGDAHDERPVEAKLPRMRYFHFRGLSTFVRRGGAASGCRTMLAQSVLSSGMRWAVRGTRPAIVLRAQMLSARWLGVSPAVAPLPDQSRLAAAPTSSWHARRSVAKPMRADKG